MICTLKPSDVDIIVPNVGINAANSDVLVTVAEPPAYPVLVVVIVAVELVPGATPVTLKDPLSLIVIVPTLVVPAHVYLGS